MVSSRTSGAMYLDERIGNESEMGNTILFNYAILKK